MKERKRILIVDDDENARKYLGLILEKKGYETETAETGQEAVAKAQGRSFHAGLLDIRLPDMEGIELLRQLKKVNPDMVIILVTGYASVDNAIEALGEGASAYFTKPLKIDEMLAKLREALEKQDLVMENRTLYQETQRELAERKRTEQALRQSETRYRTLFEDSKDAIWVATRNGRFVDVNRSLLDLFGYGREEMMALDLQQLYVDPLDFTRLQQQIEENGAVHDYEVRLRRRDGTEIDCVLSSTLWQTDDRKVLGYQGVIHDITERKRLEEAQLRASSLAALETLAGGIGHDYNNILTTILGNISLALRHAVDGSEELMFENLTSAIKACQRAAALTRQLLGLATGEAKSRTTASVPQLVRDSVAVALRGSDLKCEFAVPDDLWPVEVDRGQIRQAIKNLVTNGQGTTAQGGLLRARAQNVTIRPSDVLPVEPGTYVKISIQNTGTFIPKEQLPRIFDPYLTPRDESTSLGLATAYSVVRRHHGHIEVESEPGAGTTFHIYLPASEKEPTGESALLEGTRLGNGRILVLDDQEMVRQTVAAMLTYLGYESELAMDGSEALDLYKRAKESGQPFDAVILDLTIPGSVRGKEAMKELLEVDPGVKAVLSSGYSQDPTMARFREYGFSAAVSKPYRLEMLRDVLHGVLEGQTA